MKRKTWKQKIGKRLLEHVAETTQRSTLTEVKANIDGQREFRVTCFECDRIAAKLGLK